MTYRRLIAEHDAIEAASGVVLAITRSPTPRPAEAARALERLAQMVRDHLAGEEDAIYATLAATRDGRHADMAVMMEIELERLKDDWAGYLYRWDSCAVAKRWDAFVVETETMLGRINERVVFETMVLYSLALHHGVIEAE